MAIATRRLPTKVLGKICLVPLTENKGLVVSYWGSFNQEGFLKGFQIYISGLFVTFVLAGCQNYDSKTVFLDEKISPQVIYGDDNRVDVYQAPEPWKSMASSTVALLENSTLSQAADGSYRILGRNFGSSNNLCASEPYREQSAAAFCSGSLVAPDIVMTAGHCITSAASCLTTKIAFGFSLNAAGAEPKTLPASEVYTCAELIYREQAAAGADFALIRLDRRVSNHTVLPLRREGVVQAGEGLVVIGHPVGLPAKVAGGANVRSVSSSFFTANLDTYGGNSGSAVFNASTGEIEGILVRGETDFVRQGSCNISYRCASDACRGEDVTRIDRVLAYLPDEEGGEKYENLELVSIPDNDLQGISSEIQIPTVPAGRKILVHVEIQHTWIGDLRMTLVAPDSTKIVLHQRSGGSQDDIRGTYGEDLVAVNSLVPLQALAMSGLWRLEVRDEAGRDVGVLQRWSIEFR